MEDQDIESAIIGWIQTFIESDTTNLSSLQQLFDGNILSNILSKIDPEYFNFRLQNPSALGYSPENLHAIYEKLGNYYQQILQKNFDKEYVDLEKLLKEKNLQQMTNLVEMVLGAAVMCPNKEIFISAILTLDDSHQTTLMFLIERIMARQSESFGTKETDEPGELFDMKPSQLEKLQNEEYQKKMEMLLKIQELEKENNQLAAINASFSKEKLALLKKIDDLDQDLAKKNQENKRLLEKREGMDESELLEEMRTDLGYKEKKIDEQSKLIEELKYQNDVMVNKLKEEIVDLKRKASQIPKLESNLEFYKQKYEEYLHTANKMADFENEIEDREEKIKDLEKFRENLHTKLEKYKVQISQEKNNCLNLEMDLTRKNAEIEIIKNEKNRLEQLVNDYEGRLHDANKQIHQLTQEKEDALLNLESEHGQRSGKKGNVEGADFLEIIANLEKELEQQRMQSDPKTSAEEGQIEILIKENEILKNKCKEIQATNESLRHTIEKNESPKIAEKLRIENEKLKTELTRLNASIDNTASLEVKQLRNDNSQLREKILVFERQLSEMSENQAELVAAEKLRSVEEENIQKTVKINHLSSKLSEIEKKAQKLEEENDKKVIELDHMQKSNDKLNVILSELGDQKDEELRVLATAMHEVLLRNQELETSLANLSQLPQIYEKMSVSKLTAVAINLSRTQIAKKKPMT